MRKLDYTIESPEERKQLVEEIIAETPDISSKHLEALADYLVLPLEKQDKKEKKILTDNRLATVGKRECSFEGLAAQLENGEDGIYNLINENKNVIFHPKISITQEDQDNIPCLRQLRETIQMWEKALKEAAGTKYAYIIKKALIEMRKDQYLIKQAYQKPIIPYKLTRSMAVSIPLEDTSELDGRQVYVSGVSLMNPSIVSAILCNYSKLKENGYGNFNADTWYLVESFEEICDQALKDYPAYQRIVELKIDGLQNSEIKDALWQEFETSYTSEYISVLWRKKIPNMIADAALSDFLTWQYRERNWPMKKCTKCGQIKPAHNHFFSKNNTSRDKLYSICKACRNKKKE